MTDKPKAAPWRGQRLVTDPKSRFVAVRVTPAEHAALTAAAAQAGLSVGAYLRTVGIGTAGPRAVRRAGPLFADNCAACHGAKGKGDRSFGAPDLTDNEELYGSSREVIHDQIWNGRGGVMPAWSGRLTKEDIKALAVYVHNLGGGE